MEKQDEINAALQAQISELIARQMVLEGAVIAMLASSTLPDSAKIAFQTRTAGLRDMLTAAGIAPDMLTAFDSAAEEARLAISGKTLAVSPELRRQPKKH